VSRILIIDDSDPRRFALSEAVRTRLSGVKVDHAASGDTGLTLLTTQHYDVLICDVLMPGIDGLGVLKAAHRLRPDAAIILITSGEFAKEMEALGEGAFGFLPKPVNLEALLRLVQLGAERTALLRHTRDNAR
jgi:DNA-binding NtrC family response regulator